MAHALLYGLAMRHLLATVLLGLALAATPALAGNPGGGKSGLLPGRAAATAEKPTRPPRANRATQLRLPKSGAKAQNDALKASLAMQTVEPAHGLLYSLLGENARVGMQVKSTKRAAAGAKKVTIRFFPAGPPVRLERDNGASTEIRDVREETFDLPANADSFYVGKLNGTPTWGIVGSDAKGRVTLKSLQLGLDQK